MSENKSYSLIDLPEIPEQFCEAIADAFNDTTTPARKEIGNTFGNLFYMVFGGLNHYAQKKRVVRSTELKYFEQKQDMAYHSDLEHYISEISDKVNSIPDTKLREPKLDIVGPALEASKYYISNEEIRKMFSNLIAASMNIDTSDQVHHSYVEIIKQLSPLDAANLKILSEKNLYPVAQYKLTNEPSNTSVSYTVFKNHVWVHNPNCDDQQLNAISLSNLHRLGLATVEYSTFIDGCDYQALFKTEPTFKQYSTILSNIKKDIPITDFPDDAYPLLKYSHLVIQKGTASLTPMGKSFVSICL